MSNKFIKLEPEEGRREIRYLDIDLAKMCITLKGLQNFVE